MTAPLPRSIEAPLRTRKEIIGELMLAWLQFGACALLIAAAGTKLSLYGDIIADKSGWSGGWVGLFLLATITSLPELAVSLSALRMGALDMALANLLGSNLFNIVILAIDDLFFRAGPLLSHVSQSHAISAFSGAIMSGLVIIGIVYRPPARARHGTRWISMALIAVFSLNACALYRYGE